MAAAGGGTWGIVEMGGSAAQENNFWELFARPAAGGPWRLVTPPAVADNGGLVVAAPAAGQRLDVAFRPSQGLTFSPLALTGEGGKTWATGLIDTSVADVPDALARSGGTMLALLSDGAVDQSSAGILPAPPPAGRRTRRSRRPAGPGAAAHQHSKRRHRPAPGRPGRDGQRARRLERRWHAPDRVPPPLSSGTGQVLASGTGSGGSVWALLPGGRAEAVAGPGASWRALPPVPRDTAAVTAGAGSGAFDALAVAGGTLTVSRGTGGAWDQAQVIKVPLQYGSSS